jgi:hypothetical protein
MGTSTRRVTVAAVLFLAPMATARASGLDTPLMVTRVAGQPGTGGYGGDGGLALDAVLKFPNDVATDTAGNIYVAESQNCRVRKITATTGIISTVAGSGACTFGGDGGPATAAGVVEPVAVAVDASGNLYIGGNDHRVRKVTAATGIITTIAGTGAAGFSGDGGPATEAVLNGPTALAVAASGDVYISDYYNRRVRKITAATGALTTVAGNGVSSILSPNALALEAAGNLYIADADNYRVRKLTAATGVITTVAGNGARGVGGDGAAATDARVGGVLGVVLDGAGNLFIADSHRVRKVDAATGFISTIAGRLDTGSSGDGGPALDAEFGIMGGLAFDGAGNLLVADTTNHTIRKLSPNLHDTPLTGDFDGDRKSDLVVWRPTTGTWFWLTSTSGYDYQAARSVQWGDRTRGDVPFLGDVDGDGRADLIVWRASTGTWYWLTSTTDYSYAAAGSKQWGNASVGDVPLVADIDGDRRADLIVWRASTGTWYWLTSSTGYSQSSAGSKQWGNTFLNDVPLTGDFDGDGKADLAVWRSNWGTGLNELDTFMWTTSGSGYQDAVGVTYGLWVFGDVPILADMDGDGRSDLVVWTRQTGEWQWITAASGFNKHAQQSRQWGSQGELDRPVPADFDDDGRVDLAIWRLATGTWYWLTSRTGFGYASAHQRQWGG